MSRLEQLLETPEPHEHLLQLYGSDERLLGDNVGHYLAEGLKLGNGLLVIATKVHNAAFARQMEHDGADPVVAVESGRAIFMDAADTLAQFMNGGQPDWPAFENTIGSSIREFQSRANGGVRVYDELVGLLWNSGKYSAANRLEMFWNKLLKSDLFNLFCAYPIDVFGNEFQTAALDTLLCAHTHLLSAGEEGDLEHAILRSMADILGRRADGMRILMEKESQPSWRSMPKAEANILWLRNNIPDEAEKILSRARHYYQTSHPRALAPVH